jgi:hypothetical protein
LITKNVDNYLQINYLICVRLDIDGLSIFLLDGSMKLSSINGINEIFIFLINEMMSESLFSKCKSCGVRFSKSVRVCPQCGTKRKVKIVYWIGGVCLLLIILSSNNRSENGSIDSLVKTKRSFEVSSKEVIKEKLKLDSTWRKGGFDLIMMADFTIENSSEYDIKDIKIKCVHYSNSGTEIDSNSDTIYEIVKSLSTRFFYDFNMGFIHSQVGSSSCSIKNFTVLRKFQ